MLPEFKAYDANPEAQTWANVATGAYTKGKSDAQALQNSTPYVPGYEPPQGTYSDMDYAFFTYCYETGYESQVADGWTVEKKYKYAMEFDAALRGGLDDGLSKREGTSRAHVTDEAWEVSFDQRLAVIYASSYQTGAGIADRSAIKQPAEDTDKGSSWVAWGILGTLIGVAAGAAIVLARQPAEAWEGRAPRGWRTARG